MNPPTAIVFDFDGVLVESVDIKTAAFATLFAGETAEARHAIVAFHRANVGLSRFAKFDHIHRVILQRPLDDAGMAGLAARFADLVVDAVVACPMVAGADRLLEEQSAAGTPLFVVSATPRDELTVIVGRRGLDRYFRALYGSPRSKTDNLRALLAEHALDPTATLMIGDGRQDFEAAAACGTRFLGRVPSDASNPFPQDVPIVSDLTPLNGRYRWAALT